MFDTFRARFVGKASPVHLFWGALDLAYTRMRCGRVGCCDNSPNRHATAHWREHPEHPLIRSYESGEVVVLPRRDLLRSRRRALGALAHLMGAGAAVSAELATMLSACTICRLWAEQDEGPYHRDPQPERRDVVEDRQGIALQLGIRLVGGADGTPPDAVIEIWQCDALGRYSGFPPPDDSTVVTAETAPCAPYLPDQTFLRGRQHADADGMVEFHTIYPGWYPGRTVHIHLMVHTGERVLTSQLYFPERTNHEVLAQAPYERRPGRDTTNDTDGIFATGGGPALLDIVATTDGYRAAICFQLPVPGGAP